MSDDPFSPANQPALIRDLGMYSLPYASTWPELRDILARIYQERAAAIDWLPDGWLMRVMSLHGTSGSAGAPAVVLIPAPTSAANAVPISFLDTPAKRAWWDDFSKRANVAVVAYAAKQAEIGRVQLEKLYADSKFWDDAVNLAQFLASPITVAKTVLQNPWKSFGTVAALAGVALFLYFRPRR